MATDLLSLWLYFLCLWIPSPSHSVVLKLGTMAMSKDELDYIKNLFNKMDIDQNGRVGLTEFLKGRQL